MVSLVVGGGCVKRWFLVLTLMLLAACGSVGGPGPGPGPDPDPDPPAPQPRTLMTMAEARAVGMRLWPEFQPWGVAWAEVGESLSMASCVHSHRFNLRSPRFLYEYVPSSMNIISPERCRELVPRFDPIDFFSAPVTHIPRLDRLPLNGFTPVHWLWSDNPSERGPKLLSGSVTKYPLRVEYLPFRPNEFEYRFIDPDDQVQWIRGRWLETTQLDMKEGDTWVKLPGFTRGQFSAYWVNTPVLELDMRQEWTKNECGESQAASWSTDNMRVLWRAPDVSFPSELNVEGRVDFTPNFVIASGGVRLTAGGLNAGFGVNLTMSGFPAFDANCVRESGMARDATFDARSDDFGVLIRVRATATTRSRDMNLQRVTVTDGRVDFGNQFIKFAGDFTLGSAVTPHSYLDSVQLTFADGSMTLRQYLVSVGVLRALSFVN